MEANKIEIIKPGQILIDLDKKEITVSDFELDIDNKVYGDNCEFLEALRDKIQELITQVKVSDFNTHITSNAFSFKNLIPGGRTILKIK